LQKYGTTCKQEPSQSGLSTIYTFEHVYTPEMMDAQIKIGDITNLIMYSNGGLANAYFSKGYLMYANSSIKLTKNSSAGWTWNDLYLNWSKIHNEYSMGDSCRLLDIIFIEDIEPNNEYPSWNGVKTKIMCSYLGGPTIPLANNSPPYGGCGVLHLYSMPYSDGGPPLAKFIIPSDINSNDFISYKANL
jgi:hypothetical protein